MKPYELTREEASKKLSQKKLSSLELTTSVLQRIKETQPKLNSFVLVTEEEALRTAKIVDEKRAKGQKLSSLAGIPIGLKDIFLTQGIQTTCCSKILSNFIPPYDGTVVRKLKENDLVIGTRYHKNSLTKRTLKRNLLSMVYNHLARLILNLPFSDFQCGFKGLRYETWLKIKPLILSDQMSFDTEIIALTKHFGYKITELPVCWAEKNTEQRKSRVQIFKTGQDLIKNLLHLRRRLAHLPKI